VNGPIAKRSDRGWLRALATAGDPRLGEDWGAKLAFEIQGASGALFAAVITDPGEPGSPLRHVCHPHRFRSLVPLVCGASGEEPNALQRAYLRARQPVFALEPAFARGPGEVLEPSVRRAVLDAADYVGGAASSGSQVRCWILIGSSRPKHQVLAAIREPLGRVCQVAARTLDDALALAAGFGAQMMRSPHDHPLTPREHEIALQAVQGFADLNIAAGLRISEHTVGTHLRSVFRKLHVHSRKELVAWYYAAVFGRVG
jgi:DNA-binding CsgD family transcriptional regulator